MVIVAAAAITAAAYGTYRGGKAAVGATKKKLGERAWRNNRQEERQSELNERELRQVSEKTAKENMTFEQRLNKYKKESGLPPPKKSEKKGLGRFRK
jgi:pyruvate/2-oxoacid:ferredoxin oxidoreductase beta subunit